MSDPQESQTAVFRVPWRTLLCAIFAWISPLILLIRFSAHLAQPTLTVFIWLTIASPLLAVICGLVAYKYEEYARLWAVVGSMWSVIWLLLAIFAL
jgi:hypothetical protein